MYIYQHDYLGSIIVKPYTDTCNTNIDMIETSIAIDSSEQENHFPAFSKVVLPT